MKKRNVNRKLLFLALRYLFLLVIAIPHLWIFYAVFTPLTVYPVFFILNMFYSVSLDGVSLIIGNNIIKLVEACIAGSAYYLLLILNMTTPMKTEKRIKSVAFCFFSFLAMNIARIVVFSALLLGSFSLFNLTHLVFWYFISSLLVVFIWLSAVKLFKIKEIPAYDDLKFVYKLIKR